MSNASRREFLKHAGLGLGAGVSLNSLVLAQDARPTPSDANPAAAEQVLIGLGPPPDAVHMTDDVAPTGSNPLGPFYRKGAPFRGKVCPPFEPGDVLVVSGRVWGFDTKRPLPGAVLDVWHVDIHGNYSAGTGDFKNRSRLITAESGYYEFETIHPVAYQPSPGFWRSPHIHFRIARTGYKTLVTELFFDGDPKHDVDSIFNPALVRPVVKKTVNEHEVETAEFDIILEPDARGSDA